MGWAPPQSELSPDAELNNRPELAAALADLDAGHGTVLMVSKLDRLSRSVHDATGLLLRAERAGWGLVALDVAVDTTTPQGAAMTQILAVFAELERRLIGERTKAALAVKRAGREAGPPARPSRRRRRADPGRPCAGRQLVSHRPGPQRRRHTDRPRRHQVASGHGPLRARVQDGGRRLTGSPVGSVRRIAGGRARGMACPITRPAHPR